MNVDGESSTSSSYTTEKGQSSEDSVEDVELGPIESQNSEDASPDDGDTDKTAHGAAEEERTEATEMTETETEPETNECDAHPTDEVARKYHRKELVKQKAKSTPWAVLSFVFLTVHSLGVIYGDIGTSPLYVFSSIFGNVDFGQDEVLGAQCLITYSLIIVVFLKYICIVLNADRHGEGGVLALASIVPPDHIEKKDSEVPPTKFARYLKSFCVFLSFVGVGLLLGDGAITPAISVLSAIEGIIVYSPSFSDAEVPVGLFIIFVLFLFQKFGTSRIGTLFGPIMVIWFTCNGVLGIINIMNHPVCLLAWNPVYAYRFFATYGLTSWTLLGAVVLAITGVEALYADLGHFGPWPIRTSWTLIVFPSLLLTYFGQAGVLIAHPEYVSNVFYLAIPEPVFWPMFVLAVTAAIIASQAMISGTFSILYQASMFDYFPPLSIMHTNKRYIGQVYIPFANYLLMIVCMALILFFKNATNLAAAYGVCVTGVLCITTILFSIMANRRWHVPILVVLPIALFFFVIDFTYFTANMIKFVDGGWVPLLIATVVMTCFCCWRLGRVDINRFYKKRSQRLAPNDLQERTANEDISRSPGTGVFFTPKLDVVPKSLGAYLKVSASLPRTTVLLHLETLDIPWIPKSDRLTGTHIGNGVYCLRLRNGFMSRSLDAIELMKKAERRGLLHLDTESSRISFFLPRETLVNKFKRRFWTVWRLSVYNFLAKHAVNHGAANVVMPIPTVVEIGARICVRESTEELHPKNYVARFFRK